MATKCSLCALLLLLLLLLGRATTVGLAELPAPTAMLLPLLVNRRMYSMHLNGVPMRAEQQQQTAAGSKRQLCSAQEAMTCSVYASKVGFQSCSPAGARMQLLWRQRQLRFLQYPTLQLPASP